MIPTARPGRGMDKDTVTTIEKDTDRGSQLDHPHEVGQMQAVGVGMVEVGVGVDLVEGMRRKWCMVMWWTPIHRRTTSSW